MAQTKNISISSNVIPKIIHLIWHGGPMRPTHIERVIEWKKKNPDYQVYVYADEVFKTQIEDQFKRTDLEINIFSINSLGIQDQVTQFINTLMQKKGLDVPNFSAPSDITRFYALQKGGWYVDTDIMPIDLNTISIDPEFKCFIYASRNNNEIRMLAPSIIAVDKNHVLTHMAIAISKVMSKQLLLKDHIISAINSQDNPTRLDVTLYTTGYILSFALRKLLDINGNPLLRSRAPYFNVTIPNITLFDRIAPEETTKKFKNLNEKSWLYEDPGIIETESFDEQSVWHKSDAIHASTDIWHFMFKTMESQSFSTTSNNTLFDSTSFNYPYWLNPLIGTAIGMMAVWKFRLFAHLSNKNILAGAFIVGGLAYLFPSLVPGINADSTKNEMGLVLPKHPILSKQTPSYQLFWDKTIRFDSDTKQPIFTLLAFQNRQQQQGSMEFLGQPGVCRSEKGNQHNILSVNGIFKQVENAIHQAVKEGKLKNYVEDICQTLPLTPLEKLKKAAYDAVPHGAIRGSAQVIFYALNIRKSVSETTNQCIYYAIYLGSMFSWQYFNYYAAAPNDMPQAQKMLMAASQAALDIAALFVVTAIISQTCQLTNWIGQKSQQYGWYLMGSLFQWISYVGSYSTYAYQGYTQGLLNMGIHTLLGTLTEKLVEKSGKYAIDRYFKMSSDDPFSSTEIPFIEMKTTSDDLVLCPNLGFFSKGEKKFTQNRHDNLATIIC